MIYFKEEWIQMITYDCERRHKIIYLNKFELIFIYMMDY